MGARARRIVQTHSHLYAVSGAAKQGERKKKKNKKKNIRRPTATVDVFTPSNVIYCFKIATMSESAARCCWWLSTHVRNIYGRGRRRRQRQKRSFLVFFFIRILNMKQCQVPDPECAHWKKRRRKTQVEIRLKYHFLFSPFYSFFRYCFRFVRRC